VDRTACKFARLGAKVAFTERASPPGSPVLNGKASSSRRRPDCFGPFVVRAEFGAGRFGPVYLGRDPSTNTRVVIRTFDLSREWREFGELSDLLGAFRKLCETRVDHASVARPLAFGTEGEIPYLVYSDLAGTAMDTVMRQDGVRPVAEVMLRAQHLADAIDCAASAGVHHGMLAPCDVILDSDKTGITGFGLAQALITAEVPAAGVAPYASPQRLAGAPPTRADDVYSLAAITLELLIGTPKDPDQETRKLREAPGLPERRRLPRPAPHETRVFTTLPGVDAGKLRAAFAAAFSEEPGDRPSTAGEFVASFQDAFSTRRDSDEQAASVVSVTVVSEEQEYPSSEPVLEKSDPVLETKDSGRQDVDKKDADTKEVDKKEADKGAKDVATLAAPTRPQPVVSEGRAARRRRARARRRERQAASAPTASARAGSAAVPEHRQTDRASGPAGVQTESPKPEPRERTPESLSARPEPRPHRPAPIVDIDVDVELVPDVPTGRALQRVKPQRVPVRDTSYVTPVQSGSRAFLVAAVVVISFSAGFGGGFVAGHFARPSAEATEVSEREPVAIPEPTPAVEDSQPAASVTAKAMTSPQEAKLPSPEPAAAPAPKKAAATPVESGRLVVRSTPAGAAVVLDGQKRGITPLAIGELALGAHSIEISHPGHGTRHQRVTLSERRPQRSVDVRLRPTSVPAPAPAPAAVATNATGSLQVVSRPSGAQVFVDDNLIGTTPFVVSDVAPGSRRLRIELSGYKAWTQSVQIEPSARFRVSATLEP
jgi:serine/threonine-protein kinase